MTTVTLYEYEPSRSLKPRWALLEAGLDYESIGNSLEIVGSAELLKVQPLGKLPAAIIDGNPLFESSAIVAAIADLVPDCNLIAKPGTWDRKLHDQWTSFALTELEMWAWSAMLNTHDFLMPKHQHIPAIIEQNANLFKRGAGALDNILGKSKFLIDNRFTVTDIVVGYAVNLGRSIGFLDDRFINLHAYLGRLFDREHCTLSRT